MISQNVMQSIGWTLIHSLWQGLAIYLLIKVGSRVTTKANLRYGMGVVAMALMVISSLITFFILNQKGLPGGFQLIITAGATSAGEPVSLLQAALTWIDGNIIWLLRFWMLGFVAGLVRIAAGLWYINRLRRNANLVQAEWMDLVKGLSTSLNITRVVTMAEATIASPMVVGFVKPMILFPVGLLSGLTTEQVETILVHELSHIRRQDYIINLVQSVIETIFFFNPFALLVSAFIREERENCCDDLVIAKGISPISYVKTLAQLEAARSSSALVLNIAGNQNQLLNRIKRIMENSAKNDWGKGRLVPVALLFLGLICASWLSIASEKNEQKELKLSKEGIAQVRLMNDTSKEDGLKVIKRGRRSSAIDEPVVVEIPEVPEWTEELAEIPVPENFGFNFDEMPGIPMDFGTAMTPGMFEAPDFQYQVFDMDDSIPGYTFRLRSPEDWESFEQEFKEKFKSQFKDFYDKNQKQFDRMLEDMKSKDEARREAASVVDLQRMARKQEANDAMIALEMARHDKLISKQKMSMDVRELAKAQELSHLSKELALMAARQDASRMQMDMLHDQYAKQADMYSDMTRRFDDFKKALAEQLVADGYVKSSDEVEQLNINDNDGEMIINGKKIKEKDRIKYKALQDQYFKTKRADYLIKGRSE